MCDVQGAVASQDDQRIEPQTLDALDDLFGYIDGDFFAVADDLARVGIAPIGRAEDGPAARKDSAHVVQAQGKDSVIPQEAVVSVADAEHLTAILQDGRLCHRADDRIQPRSVPATRQNTDSFHGSTSIG